MLERFVREYSQRGYHFAYRLCGNAEEAKELLQEAFCRILRKWDRYDPSQPLENWFLTVLRNLYYDALRRQERRLCLSLDAPVPGEAAGLTWADAAADPREEALLAALERRELQEEVRQALGALSPEHRAVLTLCDMEGLRYEEIASVLDCPLGTVRSRVNRARQALRRRLVERPEEAPRP